MPPPKTHTKLSALAQTQVGLERECDTCGDAKIICHQNYAPSTKGYRGWSTTCRQCQAVGKKKITPRALVTTREIEETTDLINEMYALRGVPKKQARLDEIVGQLNARILELPEREGFELMILCLAPLIADWSEPGMIHEDIKAGLCSEARRRLIIATRYSAKSTITAMWLTYKLRRNPLVKILVLSRGGNLAKRMLRIVRRVFLENCPLLSDLIPTEECVDNVEQFQTPQTLQMATGDASFTSLGIHANIVGHRADIIVGDDIEGPADNTPEKVSQLDEELNELHMINPKGDKVLLGTYQSEFSIYAKKEQETDETGARVWELHRALMFEEDAETHEIQSRWPARFSDKDGADWRRATTLRAWRLHVQLICDTTKLYERPLKISELPVLGGDPFDKQWPLMVIRGAALPTLNTWGAPKGDLWHRGVPVGADASPFVSIRAAVDPASGLAGRDAIGLCILGITGAGLGIIVHLEGVRGATMDLAMRKLARTIQAFQVSALTVEEDEDGLFAPTLENLLVEEGYPLVATKVRASRGMKKGQRIINSLQPVMSAGRLCILECIVQSDDGGEFANQLVSIQWDGSTKKATHDDIADAVAQAVAQEKGSLVSSSSENLAEHRATRLESLLDIPMRQGGLGSSQDNHLLVHTGHQVDPAQDLPTGNYNLAEAILGEDLTLLRLESQREHLQGYLVSLKATGQPYDPTVGRRIIGLTEQIKRIKEANIL